MTLVSGGAEFAIAATNGDLGGGEVMQLRIAEALRSLGRDVMVVAPDRPADLAAAAEDAGLDTVVLPCPDRKRYMVELRRWDRGRRGVLWCNGLLPAAATAGHSDRIVHLHQMPTGPTQRALLTPARASALCTIVPSHFMCRAVGFGRVLPNWTEEPTWQRLRGDSFRSTPTIGYLGRLSCDKGVDVLAGAMQSPVMPPDARLLLAGDHRLVSGEQVRAVQRSLVPIQERVDHPGWMSRDDFFRSADLAVFPARSSEAFGLVVAEAMAAGVPFVISDAGALSEVAGPEHPWVAHAGDPDHLATVIAEALATDPEPAVHRAQQRWREMYSPAAGRRRVATLLTELGL